MAETLSAPVGPGQPNREADVRLVQRLLDRQSAFTAIRPLQSGKFDLSLETAIIRFQRERMMLFFAQGIIRPNDNTFWQLSEMQPPRILAGGMGGILLVPFIGNAKFEEADYQRVATELTCEARSVKAVNTVESSFGPYDKAGRPSILFERHLFSRFTFRRYDGRFPLISNPKPGGYKFPVADQYQRLQQAFALNRDAALKSCSWGGFQILGANYIDAGYTTVLQFVQAMCHSTDEQCDAFINFVKADKNRWKGLREKDWNLFAYHYNGPGYKTETPPYDERLRQAYAHASE